MNKRTDTYDEAEESRFEARVYTDAEASSMPSTPPLVARVLSDECQAGARG